MQVFGPRANGLFLFILIGILAAGVVAAVAGTIVLRSSYNRETFFALDQPIPFSHKHHVGQLGLDCRYCHNSVETSASAGLPATEICMTCHSQLFTDQQMLEPVRQSLASSTPIVWNRVNDLPDYVYFNHAVHVNNGVGCETCHGRVDEMPLTWRAQPLTMEWCLGCHRDPGPNLRPKEAEFAMGWEPDPAEDPEDRAARMINLMHIDTRTMTDCYVCHR